MLFRQMTRFGLDVPTCCYAHGCVLSHLKFFTVYVFEFISEGVAYYASSSVITSSKESLGVMEERLILSPPMII